MNVMGKLSNMLYEELTEKIRKLEEKNAVFLFEKKLWLDRGLMLLNEAQTTLWHDGNVSKNIDKFFEDMGREK